MLPSFSTTKVMTTRPCAHVSSGYTTFSCRYSIKACVPPGKEGICSTTSPKSTSGRLSFWSNCSCEGIVSTALTVSAFFGTLNSAVLIFAVAFRSSTITESTGERYSTSPLYWDIRLTSTLPSVKDANFSSSTFFPLSLQPDSAESPAEIPTIVTAFPNSLRMSNCCSMYLISASQAGHVPLHSP